MAYVMGSIPLFECYVRAEYTQGLKGKQGEFIKAVAHAVRCVRGHSLWVQTILMEPYGGCAFLVPIEAIVWRPCDLPAEMTYIQPWDVFSAEFGVVELDFVRRGAVEVLPARIKGQYRFTMDFIGSDLAEHVEQHKSLHLCFLDGGLVGAFPNNRLLWSDTAFWKTVQDLPRFDSLGGEYRAEGNQHIFRQPNAIEPAPMPAPVTEYVGEKKGKPAKPPKKPKTTKKPGSKKTR